MLSIGFSFWFIIQKNPILVKFFLLKHVQELEWFLEEQWGKDALTLAVKAGTELVYKMMNFYREKDFLLVWFDQCLYTIKSSLEEKFNPHEDSEEEE